MNVREPDDYENVRKERRRHHLRRKGRKAAWVCLILLVVTVLVGYFSYTRPLPTLYAQTLPAITPAPQKVPVTWPTDAEAAMGLAGQGVTSTSGLQTVKPTASVAKVMLALAVLKKHPLVIGQTGPTITMTDADVQIFNSYVALGGSTVQVVSGEKLTEYQALQAVMLPSANNVADTLAIWAYGSLSAYETEANQLATSLGMTQSHFADDASGFLPSTTSTPHDLVLLGQAALLNPVLKSIAGQSTAFLPVVGTVHNVNWLLGTAGIVGIKTGNTDEAGGCYLVAATRSISGKSVTVIAAVMGSPTLKASMEASIPLLNSVFAGYHDVTLVHAGQVVASYQVPWSSAVNVVAKNDLVVPAYLELPPAATVKVKGIVAPQSSETFVGTVSVGSTVVPLVTASPLTTPPLFWRVWRH